MSKKTKARAAERRLREKRARKSEQKARYESWSKAGANKRSKRFRKKSKGGNRSNFARLTIRVPALVFGVLTLVALKVHGGPEGCGNIGCKRCSVVARNAI
jgi:hypothetical protein